MLSTLAHWMLENGIGQNISASLLLAIPAAIFARLRVLPAWRAHHRRVIEIHERVHQQHRED